MTRIIAGSVGGRRLQVPSGRATRPTSDRVREALFSRLEHEDLLDGAAVLDLYAGSGALGLEAASRGARVVALVEHAPAALTALRANVRALGLPGVRVVGDRVERVIAAEPGEQGGAQGVAGRDAPYDLVLADPPYPLADTAIGALLAALVSGCWLAEDAALVLERSARGPAPAWPDALQPESHRDYGETRLWFARHIGQVGA